MKKMIKKCCFLVVVTISLFSYSQEIVFHKNDNSTTSELLVKQELNKHGDSLILESANIKIQQVDILNDDHFETIKVDSVKTRVGLDKLPYGNYVIQAKFEKHWIVMYMEKSRTIGEEIDFMEIVANAKLNKVTNTPTNVKDETLSLKEKVTESQVEEKILYWVVYESNTHLSSTKTMGLKGAEEINDLIYKIRIEAKSKVGRHNKLLVFEVYNTSEFMRKQLRDGSYYESTKSKSFNVKPIYNSDKEQRYSTLANVSYK
ncbi:hypothetical protein [Winogradskyella endarachnes]|uniref:DUF4198 domain-containing protein n=1 Tax=Winogradskyella endarachnes TaxID=2681965 RepID=A0A6L6UB56_9FLAO|nr:hypothetical protein [Winogradskyella endarachnes]MUU78162.1 hypothetical protein [Winogradskyella endarachnes]